MISLAKIILSDKTETKNMPFFDKTEMNNPPFPDKTETNTCDDDNDHFTQKLKLQHPREASLSASL